MNKAELIDAMADGAGLSKADAKKALDAYLINSAALLEVLIYFAPLDISGE